MVPEPFHFRSEPHTRDQTTVPFGVNRYLDRFRTRVLYDLLFSNLPTLRQPDETANPLRGPVSVRSANMPRRRSGDHGRFQPIEVDAHRRGGDGLVGNAILARRLPCVRKPKREREGEEWTERERRLVAPGTFMQT